MNKLSIPPLFMLFFLIPVLVFSRQEEGAADWDQANQAYQQGNYREAIGSYERLLESGYRSAALYYNLGNSYYRAGDLGRAVLNYERARLLAPGDGDVSHNLQVTHDLLPQELTPLPAFFLSRWWAGLRGRLSSNAWSILCLFMLWSGAGGLALWQLGKTRPQRKWGFIAGAALLLLSVLPLALALGARTQGRDSGRAVIIEEQVALHSAPDLQSNAVLSLPPGLTVELMDNIRDWYQV